MLRKGSRDYRGIIVLHPHLSVLDIILDGVQNFFGVGDAHDLELHVPELDREEGVVLPGDDDDAFVDWGADFESDAIVRKEDELGGVPDAEHLRLIQERGARNGSKTIRIIRF